MHTERTSCDLRGNTFFGEYQRLDGGLGAAVRVRYKGDRLERKLGEQAVEAVAGGRVGVLVGGGAIVLKVVEAEKAMGMHGPAQAGR